MTPAQAIAALDRAISANGEMITLRRTAGSSPQTWVDADVPALCRGYEPEQLIGSITQGDSNIILSPTSLNRAQWPGGQPPAGGTSDPRLPRANDKVVMWNRVRNVQAAVPIFMKGVLVRIELQVRG